MKLVTLVNTKNEKLIDFINFWSKLYSFSNEAIYKASISKKTLTKTDIQNLYEWKNGMRLSVQKQKSLDTKIITKLTVINKLKYRTVLEIEVFKKVFTSGLN